MAGLLGNVSQQEMEEANKPPQPFAEGDYAYTISAAEPIAQGPKGDYIPLVLTLVNSEGKTHNCYFNASMSPGFRRTLLQFFTNIQLDPNEFNDPSQLKDRGGRAHFSIEKDNKGQDRQRLAYFLNK